MIPYCHCEGWVESDADAAFCGNCSHHFACHWSDAPGCGYDPEEDE